MAKMLAAIFIVLVLFIVCGVLVPAIYQARAEEQMRRCQNHLRLIGTYGMFHSCIPHQPIPKQAQDYFPAGTLVNPKLSPEERMSWYVTILGVIEQNPEASKLGATSVHVAKLLEGIDVEKPWDAPVHESIARAQVAVVICPARIPAQRDGPAPTNYVGNGGLGIDTAALPLDVAKTKAGVFRYETRTPIEVIREGDGLSNTISVLETSRSAPWLRGGPSTVRSLDTDQTPYLGVNAPFSGNHYGRGNFSMADGSVRVIADRVSPAFFRALLTIQGNENIEETGDR
jgi:prepilin-type processing-associated H-X9-DG protein